MNSRGRVAAARHGPYNFECEGCHYAPNGTKTITVEARDSKGSTFKQEFPIDEGS